MHFSVAFSLLAITGFSAAQQVYNPDLSKVSKPTKDYWCQMEKSQCPLICLQQPGVKTQNTIKNDCDSTSLAFACVCDNNVSPNVTMYTQTIPYFLCTEWGTQCVSACKDSTCADKCRSEHTCGATDPFKGNASASASASATASQTSGSKASGTSGSTQSLAPAFGGEGDKNAPGGGSGAPSTGITYTLAISVFGVLAGFALL